MLVSLWTEVRAVCGILGFVHIMTQVGVVLVATLVVKVVVGREKLRWFRVF